MSSAMNDLLCILASVVLVTLSLGLPSLLLSRQVLPPATTRKLVHIGVSHWWLLYLAFKPSPWVGYLGSSAFILINWIAYRRHLFKALEDPASKRSLGTIYFPLALLALVALVDHGVLKAWEAGVGVMIMGWGDGMAALVGQSLGKRHFVVFGQSKSIPGTLALALFAAAVTLGFSLAFNPGTGLGTLTVRCVGMALFAGLVELATPRGLDNLSLPIICAFFFAYGATRALAGPFAIAVVFNGLVAIAALGRRSVDPSGAVIGTALGAALLLAGGISAYMLLVAFFVSSTVLGSLVGRRLPPNGIEAKGRQRDGIQVLANCGAAVLGALGYSLTGSMAFLAALAAGFASANADTWASELGVLSRRLPRSILSFKEESAGTSGAVSLLGLVASALGSGFIGLVFALAFAPIHGFSQALWAAVGLAFLWGFLGALVDSFLGSAFQAKYNSVENGAYTERPKDGSRPNTLVGGLAWVTNDTVNALSTLVAALGAAGCYWLLFSSLSLT